MPSLTDIPLRFLSILDFDHETLRACLERAAQYKAARAAGVYDQKVLKHRHVALLFEKPSLRTRSTFQIAVRELGGDIIEPETEADTQIGTDLELILKIRPAFLRSVVSVGVALQEVGGDESVGAIRDREAL